MCATPSTRSRWPGLVRACGLAGLLAAFAAAGCSHAPPPREDKAVEVDVTTPIKDDVLDFDDFTGRLDAHRTVDIRPRESGYILEAPFKEGDKVKKGDLLFQIDPRKTQADFSQADANLKLAGAERALQEANAARARTLLSTRGMAREEYDQILGAKDKAKAAEAAMVAAREKADVAFKYTRVISPIDGRISRRAVDPGNLVKADETLLTTVVEDDKVYAYFDVDERTYLELTGENAAGSPGAPAPDLNFPVLMRLANEEEFKVKGVVNFVDNRLNGNTGTIRMRGVFDNPRGVLKSGLFVRIRLPIGKPYTALLIPDEAIQSDQGRKYVFVVDKDDKAEYRPVVQGQAIQGPVLKGQSPSVGLRVIKKGLAEGERVIISGMQRVQRQRPVQATMKDPPASPGFPLGRLLGLTADGHAEKVPSSKKD